MNKNNNKALLALSFAKGFTSPNMPIVTLTQGTKEFNFILDTGCDVNVIDKTALETIEHQPIKTNKVHTLTGLGGVTQVELCTITFNTGNETYTSEYNVSDLKHIVDSFKAEHAICIHGMLGSSFLLQQNLVMDFSEMMVYNKHDIPRD